MALRADQAGTILSLSAVDLRDRLASGALRAVELVEACLARIAAKEPAVQAWAWLDGAHALEQAAALDKRRQAGLPIGALHGLPVGLKDVIDTKGIPTENGTSIDAGRVPAQDAWLVARLRAEGAIVMGKTVTTEGAFMHPGKTRNPHNPAHTPGGSSQGSAAAVAAGMVPLAVGTQTGGSVIRPASFCGIVGFKPSFGLIPRSGVLTQSPFLDTIGVFGKTVEDCALLTEVLAGYDPADKATAPLPTPRLLSTAMRAAPVTPTFAMVTLPGQDQIDPEMQGAMDELAGLLPECFTMPLQGLDDIAAIRQRINYAEMAKCYFALERRGRTEMSAPLLAAMDEGKAVLARDYIAALDWRELMNSVLTEIFDRCDAILSPAALGPAPVGLASTGSSLFNGLWTMAGVPTITLPLFTAENGMPMGVQLVARRGDDARLLRTARWLSHHIQHAEQGA